MGGCLAGKTGAIARREWVYANKISLDRQTKLDFAENS
jgi:hypothetical protein